MAATMQAQIGTGSSVSWANVEGGCKFNLADSATDTTTPIAIPTTTGTNYSWIKNLVLAVTATSTTSINNRRISRAVTNEKQSVTITGSPTGGTFTLTFSGQTTAGIAYNAAASAVQSALEALSNIGVGDVSVTGSAGGPWTVEFTGALGDAAQALMTANGSGLTGGSSPSVSIARVQSGTATGLKFHWKAVAVASYAQAASGNRPASSGSNGAVPSGYTEMTTTAAQYDNTTVATSSTGPNGSMAVVVLGIDNLYTSGPGNAQPAPNIILTYDEF